MSTNWLLVFRYTRIFNFNRYLSWESICTSRRVARLWKKGGLFSENEKSANDLDPNFHCSWISKLSKSENWNGISRKARKFIRFFSPKTGGLQQKKKRSSPKLRLIFRPKSEIQTLFHTKSLHLLHNFGTQFPLGGGAVFNFSPKIGLKSTKNVRFCILHKPMGGRPPAPLATLLCTSTASAQPGFW